MESFDRFTLRLYSTEYNCPLLVPNSIVSFSLVLFKTRFSFTSPEYLICKFNHVPHYVVVSTFPTFLKTDFKILKP